MIRTRKQQWDEITFQNNLTKTKKIILDCLGCGTKREQPVTQNNFSFSAWRKQGGTIGSDPTDEGDFSKIRIKQQIFE